MILLFMLLKILCQLCSVDFASKIFFTMTLENFVLTSFYPVSTTCSLCLHFCSPALLTEPVFEGGWCQKRKEEHGWVLWFSWILQEFSACPLKGFRFLSGSCRHGYWGKKFREWIVALTGGNYFVNRVFIFDKTQTKVALPPLHWKGKTK